MKQLSLPRLLAWAFTSLFLLSCDSSRNEASYAPVKAKDRWLVDGAGRVLMIRGVNQVNKRPPYDHVSLGFDDSDAQLLRDYGFNAVRLGVMWAAVEPARGQYDLDYLESIRGTIRLLDKYGIFTLLDFHQDGFSTKNGGSGFPEWAAIGGGNRSSLPFPVFYFDTVNNAIARDFDAFWKNDQGVQDAYLAMLAVTVKAIGGERGVLGIEFMNEPFPGVEWQKCGSVDFTKPQPWNFPEGCKEFDSGPLTDFYQRAIAAVRQVNREIMVVYGDLGIGGVGAPPHIGRLPDANKAFSWHNYFFEDFDSIFRNAEGHQASSGSAMMLTEFGANENPEKWIEVVELSERYLMPWFFWAYSNNPPYAFPLQGNLPPDGRLQGLVYDLSKPFDAANLSDRRAVNLSLNRLEALSRPYAQLIAGVPRTMSFDTQSKRAVVEWSYDNYVGSSPQTVIHIPRHHYPNGYSVSVEGCSIISGSSSGLRLVVSNGNAPDFRAQVVITAK